MIICEDPNSLPPLPDLEWSDCMFVLLATCTATVSAALNLGLLASAVFAGATARHPVTMQLCFCGVIACSASLCHVRQKWAVTESEDYVPFPAPCRMLDLAALFGHCSLVCLALLDLRYSSRGVVTALLSFIAWCATGLVSLAAGVSCSQTSAVLVFCFYVLHVPLMILLIASHRPPRLVVPLDVAAVNRRPVFKKSSPQVFLLLLGTIPQGFLVAAEALRTRPFPRADPWCCLAIALVAAFRPLLDVFLHPELGDAVAQFIGSLCRKNRIL